jgi:hypothetical protein
VVPSCQKDKARLGYARDAVNSYFVFRVMKEKGVLPPHIRFQVSIPDGQQRAAAAHLS